MNRFILLIVTILSLGTTHARLRVIMMDDITATTSITDTRTDLNGNPCAEIRITEDIDNIAFQGNIIGEVINLQGWTSVFISHGTKKISVSTPNDDAVFIEFRDFGIKALEKDHVYRLQIKQESERPLLDRLAEAQIIYDAGLTARALEMCEQFTDPTGDEYRFMAMCALNLDDKSRYASYTKEAALRDNIEALYYFAQFYDTGSYGYPKDPVQAAVYFNRAAELGCTGSTWYLISYYTDDESPLKNEDSAKKWLLWAIETGDDTDRSDAYALLGQICEDAGNIVEAIRNYEQSITYANDYTDRRSFYRLGMMYENGRGVKKDIDKAAALLKAGAAYNDEAKAYYETFKSRYNL